MAKYNHSAITVMVIFFLFIAICLCILPLVVSLDSIYGFWAYNGTVQTGCFNSLQEVSQADVAIVKNHFVAWWSPGQWMAPGLISFLTGSKLGVSSIIITVIFSALGIVGFYKLFRYFEFSVSVTILSLLIIELNDVFYTQFVIYQGGEVLSFGIFPWFLLFVSKMNIFSWSKILFFFIFFLGCFVAKTTLIVYCSIIIFYKIFEKFIQKDFSGNHANTLNKATLLWMGILWAIGCGFIKLFYIQKGPRIVFIDKFNPELSDILIPISSPLSGILSVQTIIQRIQKAITINIHNEYISLILYFILGGCTIVVLYTAFKNQKISNNYLSIFTSLYMGVGLFFIAGYLFDANIDKNIRHFKFLGCLFVPVLVSQVQKLSIVRTFVFLFAIYSICDFVYLKNKWSKSRYISKNYFFRNYYHPDDIDKVDEQTYGKIMTFDQSIPLHIEKRPVIFFLESNFDIAIDIRHPSVFEMEGAKLGSKEYRGNGAVVFIAVSKETFYSTNNLFKRLLPDYSKVEKIDETDQYLFFRSR